MSGGRLEIGEIRVGDCRRWGPSEGNRCNGNMASGPVLICEQKGKDKACACQWTTSESPIRSRTATNQKASKTNFRIESH